MLKRVFLVLVVLAICINLQAQEGDPGFSPDGVKPQTSAFRKFLSKFSFNAQLGYGRTFYTHDISDFAILRNNGELVITTSDNPGVNNTVSVYKFWLNDPRQVNKTVTNTDRFVSSDSSTFRLLGRGNNIPLNLSIHFTIKEKFRIGGGATFELHSISKVFPQKGDSLGSYESNFKSTFFKRYYGLVGYRFLAFRNLSYVAEAKIGSFKLSNKYNSSLIQKSLFFDIGVSIERHLSEYFRITMRPSFEFKNYQISVPNADVTLKHKMITPYVTIGASYSFPELKRCPVKSCHIQVNHVHGGKEYRSRRHPFYKKQNPNYGENYPQLYRYKGKNKKKL